MTSIRTPRAPRKRHLEIFPHGFSIANGATRPVLIFKDKSGEHVLPVWVHPLDATMALHEQAAGPAMEPHTIARALLARLGMKATRCDIDEIVDQRQYARLQFCGTTQAGTGRRGVESIRVRADYAMSFCLSSRARFFSTPEFMAKCRTLGGAPDAALERLETVFASAGLVQFGEGGSGDADGENGGENDTKNPSYMM